MSPPHEHHLPNQSPFLDRSQTLAMTSLSHPERLLTSSAEKNPSTQSPSKAYASLYVSRFRLGKTTTTVKEQQPLNASNALRSNLRSMKKPSNSALRGTRSTLAIQGSRSTSASGCTIPSSGSNSLTRELLLGSATMTAQGLLPTSSKYMLS